MFGLIPQLDAVETGFGAFTLGPRTRIVAEPSTTEAGEWLRAALRPATGLWLALSDDGVAPADAIDLRIDPTLGAEAFELRSTPDTVLIVGGDPAGVFYGCQVLLQLLPPSVYRAATRPAEDWSVPSVVIRDRPRFAWRGVMLDVVRHFIPKHELLRYIDIFALHRLNTLHLHLTDDQGWRIEIERYPRLTEVGAWRTESPRGASPDAPGDGRPHGGYYTQDDLREIVAYAAERFITVVPEIETPGHVRAALAAYPELGVTGKPVTVSTRWGVRTDILNVEESTVVFFQPVLNEVMEIFPSPYIGVGGDECPKTQWRSDARTQERMRELGIASEAELQSWFMARLEEGIHARGRRMFGWDEILEGSPSRSTTVASWRGVNGAISAAKRGHDVVSCPDNLAYLDYRQSDDDDEPVPFAIPVTVRDTYHFNPVPSGLTPEEAAHVIGGQANVWTENMDSSRAMDYMIFPRLCAIADALWRTGPANYDAFAEDLTVHLKRLRAMGVEYRESDGPRPWQRRPDAIGLPSNREDHAAHVARLTESISS